jgi:hypothetical protein
VIESGPTWRRVRWRRCGRCGWLATGPLLRPSWHVHRLLRHGILPVRRG